MDLYLVSRLLRESTKEGCGAKRETRVVEGREGKKRCIGNKREKSR